MTVKSLTPAQKSTIVYLWQSQQKNMTQLAIAYNRSQRTIGRVLIEAGVATHQERYEGNKQAIYELTLKHKITYSQLRLLLEKTFPINRNKPIANTQQLPLLLDKNKNREVPHDKQCNF